MISQCSRVSPDPIPREWSVRMELVCRMGSPAFSGQNIKLKHMQLGEPRHRETGQIHEPEQAPVYCILVRIQQLKCMIQVWAHQTTSKGEEDETPSVYPLQDGLLSSLLRLQDSVRHSLTCLCVPESSFCLSHSHSGLLFLESRIS